MKDYMVVAGLCNYEIYKLPSESDNFDQAPKILMESWTMEEVLVSESDNNLPGVNATHIRRKVREVGEKK